MSDRNSLKYTAEHEWLAIDGKVATIGITDYAADQLGDVVYVELPSVGDSVTAGTVVGEIESTKSVGELFAPLNGTVVAVNDAVVDSPELVNSDAFGEGWLIKLEVADAADFNDPSLIDADAYSALTGE